MSESPNQLSDTDLQRLAEEFGRALARLEQAGPVTKRQCQQPVLDEARRLLQQPGGVDLLWTFARRLDASGIFAGSDWDRPDTLLPKLVSQTLDHGEAATITLEILSELRLLAIATGASHRAGMSAEQARRQLTQIVALNLPRLFGMRDEAARESAGPMTDSVDRLLTFLLERIDFGDILESLLDEIQRILAQRPIQIDAVKAMISQIAVTLKDGAQRLGDARLGADRLTSALFGPTPTCADDPGVEAYRARLDAMDPTALQQECRSLSRAMHDTGLVSDYHALLVSWLVESGNREMLGDALGLSSTGIDALHCHPQLVTAIVDRAIHPDTAQAVYGLAMLLERGLLHAPPIGPALWRQIRLQLTPGTRQTLIDRYGPDPAPEARLLAGVVSVLGQPLGIGQGNNPTCQSARAMSMWSMNEPDYLLHLIAQVASHEVVEMHFEGQPLRSTELPSGLVSEVPIDTDPVSTLLVPHLDRIYAGMGALCEARGEDPHRWINPEFHGWWVGRQFAIAVDVGTGALDDLPGFARHFYASYHPHYNGNQPVIHPQPAGLAVTDSNGEFVGWHAITLLRVAADQEERMRVYFYNPNNDSSQDWGHGVQVSISGHGERHGEASLPFGELASRLYIFHDDPIVPTHDDGVPQEAIDAVVSMATESWAASRVPPAAAALGGD